MTTTETDALVDAAQQLVRQATEIAVRGAGTKQALHNGSCANVLDLRPLSGIVAYDPSEYTFTALAGTKLSEIQDRLLSQGQYMPFDPTMVARGATLGGVVAAGLNGPSRMAHGGLRDFILGIQFIDGRGQLVRAGGKVVKNAAGFDLPKFFVGSIGQFGAMTELTFKVFPKPAQYLTLRYAWASLEAAVAAIFRIQTAPLQIEAIDLTDAAELLVRLSGKASAIQQHAGRIDTLLEARGERLHGDAERAIWHAAREFTWCDSNRTLIKVPLVACQIVDLDHRLTALGCARQYSCGGNVAWVATRQESLDQLDELLAQHALSGMLVTGRSSRKWFGNYTVNAFQQRVKKALDPENKFGKLEPCRQPDTHP